MPTPRRVEVRPEEKYKGEVDQILKAARPERDIEGNELQAMRRKLNQDEEARENLLKKIGVPASSLAKQEPVVEVPKNSDQLKQVQENLRNK